MLANTHQRPTHAHQLARHSPTLHALARFTSSHASRPRTPQPTPTTYFLHPVRGERLGFYFFLTPRQPFHDNTPHVSRLPTSRPCLTHTSAGTLHTLNFLPLVVPTHTNNPHAHQLARQPRANNPHAHQLARHSPRQRPTRAPARTPQPHANNPHAPTNSHASQHQQPTHAHQLARHSPRQQPTLAHQLACPSLHQQPTHQLAHFTP